MEADKHSYKRS